MKASATLCKSYNVHSLNHHSLHLVGFHEKKRPPISEKPFSTPNGQKLQRGKMFNHARFVIKGSFQLFFHIIH